MHLMYHAYDIAQNVTNHDLQWVPTRQFDGIRFKVRKPKTTWYYISIQYRATRTWNSREPHLRKINSKKSFKAVIKRCQKTTIPTLDNH